MATLKVRKQKPPKNWKIGYFMTADGKQIRHATIPSAQKPEQGKVVLTGGYGLDIEYYRKAIKNWSDRGFTVHAMDLYGQGGSDRHYPEQLGRPSPLGFEDHATILNEFITKIVKPNPNATNILSAHSQSGGILPIYLERHENDAHFPFKAAVLGSPLFALNTFGKTPGKLFRAFVYAADFMGLGGVSLKLRPPTELFRDFTNAARGTDKDDVANDNKDRKKGPAIDRFLHISFRDDHYPAEMDYPTIEWFKSFFESQKKLTSSLFSSIKTPVLIVSPTEDQYVDIEAKHDAAGHMQNAKIVMIPRADHGIWYHKDKEIQDKLWQAIDGFVAENAAPTADHEHTAPPPSTSDLPKRAANDDNPPPKPKKSRKKKKAKKTSSKAAMNEAANGEDGADESKGIAYKAASYFQISGKQTDPAQQ